VLLHKADALTESLQEIEKRLAAVDRKQ